jgi:type IV pilus assembly protein PilX
MGIKRQSGVVLPVTILILALLMIGLIQISEINTTSSKISSSDTDKSIAFESAETTLRFVENWIADLENLDGFDGNAGLYGVDNLEPDPLNPNSYSLTAPIVGGASSAPRYFVKYLGEYLPESESIMIGGYGAGSQPGKVSIFRITVMASGVSNDINVVLQTYYERRFL